MSEESIENITKSNSEFTPSFVYHHVLPDINFNVHCLIKNNIESNKSICFLYTRSTIKKIKTGFILGNSLFGSAKLTMNADLDRYKYSCYGVGFDLHTEFSLPEGSMGRNFIIYGADLCSSVQIDNRGKDILVLGEGPTKALDDKTLTAKAKYPINFAQSGKRLVLSLNYNGSNSFLFANGTKVYQFKAKDSEIKYNELCLGNISKDLTINNMTKAGLKGVANFFLLILILLILMIF